MSRDPTPDLLFPTCAECQSMGVVMPEWLPAMEAELGSEAVKAFLLRHAGRQVTVPVPVVGDLHLPELLRRDDGLGLRLLQGPTQPAGVIGAIRQQPLHPPLHRAPEHVEAPRVVRRPRRQVEGEGTPAGVDPQVDPAGEAPHRPSKGLIRLNPPLWPAAQ